MENASGPYIVKYTYVIQNITHNHEVNCYASGVPEPGTPPEDVSLISRDGLDVEYVTAVNDYWNIVREILPLGAVGGPAVLWRVNPDNAVRTFITAASLTSPLGITGAPNLAHYQVLTMRSTNGGIAKFQFMETSNTENSKYPIAPVEGSGFPGLAFYLASDENWIVARDDGWPAVSMNLSNGQNEALARKRYRS